MWGGGGRRGGTGESEKACSCWQNGAARGGERRWGWLSPKCTITNAAATDSIVLSFTQTLHWGDGHTKTTVDQQLGGYVFGNICSSKLLAGVCGCGAMECVSGVGGPHIVLDEQGWWERG